ncbi:unnamed protein product [Allacma fusca]|uniref:Secreted protein n=1 Tax=Allacma fusca TaxID=39272 RepID=A0A8J2K0F1_9HEXA|nr:unnamed protein product [Allacma fusca]
MKFLPGALLLLLAIPAVYIPIAQAYRAVQCAACGDLGNDKSLKDCYTNANSLNIKTCPDGCMFMYMKPYYAASYPRYTMARRDCEFTIGIYTKEYGCYGPLANFSRLGSDKPGESERLIGAPVTKQLKVIPHF